MGKRNTRILFADDEPAIRMTLPAILQQEGFEVSVAATVAEALAYINRDSFDVLLADLNIGVRGMALRSLAPCGASSRKRSPSFSPAIRTSKQHCRPYETR